MIRNLRLLDSFPCSNAQFQKGLPTMSKKQNRRSAFSLLELLAVVTILGVIAVVVVPRISTSSDRAKQEVNRQNMAEINSAVERWYFEKGSWPSPDLSDIGADPGYFPEGIPVNPVSGATYSLDKTTFRVIRD